MPSLGLGFVLGYVLSLGNAAPGQDLERSKLQHTPRSILMLVFGRSHRRCASRTASNTGPPWLRAQAARGLASKGVASPDVLMS